MPTIALITPGAGRVTDNLGINFITAGIEWLLKAAYPDAIFKYVDMTGADPDGFKIIREEANMVVVCGNPRFNASERKVFCDSDLFYQLDHLKKPRPYLVDAYAGAAMPLSNLSIEKKAALLLNIQKNRTLLDILRSFDKIIVRDELAEKVFSTSGINTFFLPDSTYFAPLYYGVRENLKVQNAVVLFKFTDSKERIENMVRLAQKHSKDLPLEFIATNDVDYTWFKQTAPPGLIVVKINNPVTLLQTLAVSEEVLSCRIHTAIPALALGCKVCYISIDTRDLTLAPFSIPRTPTSSLNTPKLSLLYGGTRFAHSELQNDFINTFADIKI